MQTIFSSDFVLAFMKERCQSVELCVSVNISEFYASGSFINRITRWQAWAQIVI